MAIIAGYFLYTRSNSTIRTELRDFAVSDTASIDKIFMADRQGKSVLLERKPNAEWWVNGKFRARPDMINTLLYTIKSLEVRSPVGKNLYNQTMKLLASNAVKVEIYTDAQLAKTYYVGHPSMDNMGTFMYLEGSSVPFIMCIPGFNGYLTTRYFIKESEWRSKTLFNYNPRSITKVQVRDMIMPDSSFTLSFSHDSTFSVMKNNGETLKSVDLNKVVTYLSSFGNINYEKILEEITDQFRDSLMQIGPFKTIEVELAGGQEKKVKLFRKKFTGETMSPDDEGVVRDFDPDRFYLLMEGEKTWYICQYLQWNKLLKTPSYFLPMRNGKK